MTTEISKQIKILEERTTNCFFDYDIFMNDIFVPNTIVEANIFGQIIKAETWGFDSEKNILWLRPIDNQKYEYPLLQISILDYIEKQLIKIVSKNSDSKLENATTFLAKYGGM